MKVHRLWLASLLFAVGIVDLPAQVTLTFSGVASNTALGYNVNDPVTFTFTIGSNFTTNSNWYIGPIDGFNLVMWSEDLPTHDSLFASITGTGLTGSYAPAPGEDRFNEIFTTDQNPTFLSVVAMSEGNDTSLGSLLTPDLSPVSIIGAGSSTVDTGHTFTFPSSFVSPESYLTGHTGTYTGLNYDFAIGAWYQTSAVFAIDTVTIGVAPVPEPATYAIVAGVLVLGMVWRTRSRS